MSIIYPATNLQATERMIIDRGEGIYVFDNRDGLFAGIL